MSNITRRPYIQLRTFTYTQAGVHTRRQTHRHAQTPYPVHPHTNSPGRTEWPRSAKTLQSSSVHSHTRVHAHAHTHSAALSVGSQQARSLSGPVKWLAQHCALLPHLFTVSLLTQPYVSYAALMIKRLAKDSSWSCHQEIKMQNFQDTQCSLEEPRNIWLTDNVSTMKCMIVHMCVNAHQDRDKHRHWLQLKTWSSTVFCPCICSTI